MATVLQIFLVIFFVAVGVVAGTIGAFFATFYICVFIDFLNGAKGGDGLVAVGWIFCFLTVPLGLVGGGYLGFLLSRVVGGFVQNWFVFLK